MAPGQNVLRTCGFIISLISHVHFVQGNVSEPRIVSVEVAEKTCVENKCKYSLNVDGGEFLGHYSWRLTPGEAARGSVCGEIAPDYELREIETARWKTKIEVEVPHQIGRIFFCLQQWAVKDSPTGSHWVHQGPDLYLDPENDFVSLKIVAKDFQPETPAPPPQNLKDTEGNWTDLSHDIDVNHLTAVRLTRDEQKDIELLIRNKYVPLNQIRHEKSDVHAKGAGQKDASGLLNRLKRGTQATANSTVVKPNTDELLTTQDIVDAKRDLENTITHQPKEEKHDDALIKVRKERDSTPGVNVENVPSFLGVNREYVPSALGVNIEHGIVKTRKERESSTGVSVENLPSFLGVNAEYVPSAPGVNPDHKAVKVRKERESSTGVNVEKVPSFLGVNREDEYLPQGVTKDHIPVVIDGLRVEDSAKEPKIVEESIPSVLADTRVTLRLFGDGLTTRTVIAFTYDAQEFGEPCKFLVKGEYQVKKETVAKRTAVFDVKAPPPLLGSKLYICAKNLHPDSADPLKDENKYIHQGNEPFKIMATHTKLLPLWVTLVLVMICLMFSALFSGLNLGLMSLDRTELKIISNTGTEQEKKYAKAIMPVRDHGNYLLCSILLGNVAVNSTFTILLDDLTSGLFAVIFSTLAIVLLGEITPQAICSRHGLMVGAKSIMVTKAVMGLTAPLAFPVSKLLDYFLGEEIGSVYNRERLKELVKVMYEQVTTDLNDLDKDEVNIISGALELRKKTVSSVMTKLEDVFMLPITSVLDFETMSEIVKSGFSRIPVYEGHRGNIVTVLFIKDLAFVDPDDNTPLRTLCQYYQNPCNFVFEDVTLDVMFKQFKDGHKGHMAFVHRINSEGEGDPFYETIGLVTLEDVIEEMIQSEIVDETDVFMDNRTKRRRNRPLNKLQDFAAFAERHDNQHVHISPQLTLATFQFLSTSVDAFRPDMVSETVLRRLLRQDVIQYIKLKGKSKKDPTTFVYHQGKPVDYFVLILEGRVEVTVGRENLVFEAGPFTYFGVQALALNVGIESPTASARGSLQNIPMDSTVRHTFVPDYSVRAIADTYYLTVKRSLYLAAKRATMMEVGALSKGANQEQFDNEVDKNLCNTSNADLRSVSKKLLGISMSNASARDLNVAVTSVTADKPCRTNNIIELLQVCAHCDSAVCESQTDMPRTAQSLTKQSRIVNNEIDAINCAECLRNNFWTARRVLHKSFETLESCVPRNSTTGPPGQDTPLRKKRTTFHADASLLSFHDPSASDVEIVDSTLCQSSGVCDTNRLDPCLDRDSKLLLAGEEDVSIAGDQKTPSRQTSPNPPVSACPHTRSSFTSRTSPDCNRNGDVYKSANDDYKIEEQEKLLKST